jgi:anti-sigma B factor antagonist
MEINFTRAQSLVIARLTGRFNIEEVINFEKVINNLIVESPRVICLNMAGLRYIDSSGIGSLIKAMNITKNKDIDLIITDLDKDILHIFKLAYLDRFFNISTQDEVLKKYS